MSDDEETADPARKIVVGGLIVGGTMVTVGPLAGLMGAANGLIHAFDATREVAAADKSTMLSAGIAESMKNATNVGLGVAAVGGVIASICAVLLWQRTKSRRR